MDDEDVVEVVKRFPILDALTNRPRTAAQLADRLSFSRSTVHRSTNRLADLGLLRKREDAFELTSFGRVATRSVAECRRDLDTASQLAPFLEAVETEVSFPVGPLSDASVTPCGRRRPHFAVKRVSDMLADSDSLRMFSGIVSPVYVERCCEHATDGSSIRAVFDRQVVDILFDDYASESKAACREGDLEVLIHDDCPFDLFVFDDRVAMTTHRADGSQAPFVESADPDVYEWAEQLFESYVSQAEFATLF